MCASKLGTSHIRDARRVELVGALHTTYPVPEQFSGQGLFQDVAEQGGASTTVSVPFSEAAIRVWVGGLSQSLSIVQRNLPTFIEVLEVRATCGTAVP